jgi:hypothetical protein
MPEHVQSGNPEDAPTAQSSPAEDEISLLDLLIVLAHEVEIETFVQTAARR